MTEPLPDDAALLQFVAVRDVLCPLCKYNLRGLTVPRCPECGRSLKLSVGTMEPILAAWVTLAIGAFASSGIGVLLTAYYLYNLRFIHFSTQESIAWWSFMLSLPIAVAAIITHRRFLRLSRFTQWILAAIVLGISVAQMSLFIMHMR